MLSLKVFFFTLLVLLVQLKYVQKVKLCKFGWFCSFIRCFRFVLSLFVQGGVAGCIFCTTLNSLNIQEVEQ